MPSPTTRKITCPARVGAQRKKEPQYIEVKHNTERSIKAQQKFRAKHTTSAEPLKAVNKRPVLIGDGAGKKILKQN